MDIQLDYGNWIRKNFPQLQAALEGLVESETAGNPMNDQKWQRSSLRHLNAELTRIGHAVSITTVERLLKKLKYSLKANVKRLAGAEHPDRKYLKSLKELYMAAGLPVISVDTKKTVLRCAQIQPGDQNLRRIEAFIASNSILACDAVTAFHYGSIKDQLRKKGKPIPENDIWIAAIALQFNSILVSRDVHFSEVQGLTVENW